MHMRRILYLNLHVRLEKVMTKVSEHASQEHS